MGATNSDTSGGIGGSIFNALTLNLNLDISGTETPLDIPGQGVGPLGALTSWTQLLATLIGWDGTGNPLDVLLTDSSAMTAGATADMSTLAGDLTSMF
ncbi:hypothetical protein [Mycobacterium sp.]|uniref:hypothetical protein n=1 Tax=Mycobacterium sp. TaxID=1785 RepID=UPI0031DD21A5